MAGVALADRVVEVITDLGPAGWGYGSGCVVAGTAVLTAAHVVAGARSVSVRDPAKHKYVATVDAGLVGDLAAGGPDLAVVDVVDPGFVARPPMALAAVRRDSSTADAVERCHAVGYPWFAQTPSPHAVRDTVDAIGVVPVLSRLVGGLLSLQVTVQTPRELPPANVKLVDSVWSGISGAPVVAAGRLVGVVSEHAPRESPAALTVVPLTALEATPGHPEWGDRVADAATWWARLGVTGAADLEWLPPERPEPAYWATLRDRGRALHARMPQLRDRGGALADIEAFATGPDGYRWLVGGPYTGKTALVYEVVTAALGSDVDVVAYFLSRQGSDASGDRFVAAVVPQLAYLLDLGPPTATADEFRRLWEQAVARAKRTRRHLLLVVDGLDEDLLPPGSPNVAYLLPSLASGRAHVLVTSRHRSDLPHLPPGHPLAAVAPVELAPFPGAAQLADQARDEVNSLTHGADRDLAVEVLGLLAAAAGPLSVSDLAALTSDIHASPTAAQKAQVRGLVNNEAARSLERVGAAGGDGRYQFAHRTLLDYAQADDDLRDPEYRARIHSWAERWRDAAWPAAADGAGTPRYLLDKYAATLAHDPDRLARLVTDPAWVAAAIGAAGIDQVAPDLRMAARFGDRTASDMARIVEVHGHDLRPPAPADQPAYVLRQLCLWAMEHGSSEITAASRTRLGALADPGAVPLWTTRRESSALVAELGFREGKVSAVGVLPDGRVVTGADDWRVRIWDPGQPGADPVELGSHEGSVWAAGVLPDGRVVTGGSDGRVRIWDPGRAGAGPVELGSHEGLVRAAGVLPDGRVVTGGSDRRVRIWDPTTRGVEAEIGCTCNALGLSAPTETGQTLVIGGEGLSAWHLPPQRKP